VEEEFSGDSWTVPGYFGYSNIGAISAGSAPPGTPTSVFASGGISQFTLYAVPEPATLALAGLGGISMLFLRRRK